MPICLGDSIAVGLQCEVSYAQAGIGSGAAAARWAGRDADVISLGSNDPMNPRLRENLERIRRECVGSVIWIVPRHPRAAAIVRLVAAKWRDRTLEFQPAADGIHPADYGKLRRRL
jgi:alkanesulfonate monooxygenase SsuD/methylene tetrahydromethanopterin reductase-like flavin-dependent oxidoreductase (luciferase family)